MSQNSSPVYTQEDRLEGSIKWASRLETTLIVTFLVALACMFILPLLIAIGDSLKSFGEIYAVPRIWIPSKLRWANYKEVFDVLPFFTFIKNTIMLTAIALFGQVTSACIVGYSFARLRWPFRDLFFIVLLSTMMLPKQVTMIPMFLLFNQLGWVNTWLPLCVPAYFGVNVFNVFLLRQFFKGIPLSLEDAAKIDGCSHLRILTQIMIPLSKPAVISICVLGFIHWWNDFMGPLIYLSDHSKFTISVGINMFKDAQSMQPHYIMAASIISVMPVLLIFFSAQKYFVKGVALSGQKG